MVDYFNKTLDEIRIIRTLKRTLQKRREQFENVLECSKMRSRRDIKWKINLFANEDKRSLRTSRANEVELEASI